MNTKTFLLATCLLPTSLVFANPIEAQNTEPTADTVQAVVADSTKKSISLRGNTHLAAVVGFGSANFIDKGQIVGKDNIISYLAGAAVTINPFAARNLAIESGVIFQHKGYETINEGYEIRDDFTTHLYYLQMPLYVNYTFHVDKVGIVPQMGPYFAICVSGHQKGYMQDSTGKTHSNINLFDEENFGGRRKHRRFDCGLHWGLNLLLREKLRIGIAYDLGLVNLRRKDYLEKKTTTLNGVFTLQAAYYLF